MATPRKNSTSPDRYFDDHEYRDFEPPRQPEEEKEDIQELHKRTMNQHTEVPIINTPQKDASGCSGFFFWKNVNKTRFP